MSVRPILLLSLPRAGSTLVQRVLAAHPRVATASEPWLLLPLAYSMRREGARAEYWHPLAAQAIGDLASGLPGGRDEYMAEAGRMARRVYAARTPPPADHFVDKTPRYHLIAEDLPRMLPDAKLVFLWRNPLAALASLLRTFRDGRWEPPLFEVDLEIGVRNLAEAWRRHRDDPSAVAVRFEDLLKGDAGWRELFEGLELEWDRTVLDRFPEVRLEGRYGDPTGIQRYSSVSRDPTCKWLADLAGPVRRRWARRYLARIASELETMGYSREELEAALAATEPRPWTAPADAIRLLAARRERRRHLRAVRAPDSPQPVPTRKR